MSKVLINESNLENIADAIRTKLRTEDTFYPSQMAAAIGNISVIDIDPTLTQSGQAADAKVTGDRIRETEAFIHSMIDDTLSIYGKAADARITGQRIGSVESDLSTLTRRHNELSYDEMLVASEVEDARIGANGTVYNNIGNAIREQIQSVQGVGISDDVKTALLNCFQHVAWVDDNGQDYYNALSIALNHITWTVLNMLSGCSTSNQKTEVRKDSAYSAIITPNADYTLNNANASIVMGDLDITSSVYSVVDNNARISISQVTGDLTITITAVQLTVTSISASFNQGSNVITTENSLDDLREYLTVTANYSDSTSRIVTAYSLNGTLTEGTSAITVSYSGKSATFNVLVSSPLPAGYTRLEYVSANGLQYINSGINEAQTTHAKYKIRVTSTPAHNGNHILSSANTYFPFFKFYDTGKATKVLGNKFRGAELPHASEFISWEVNTVYEIEGYVNGNAIIIDGTQVKELSAGSTFSSSNDLYFFAYGGNVNNSNYRFNGDLFEAKIYGENEALLRNYIPCKNSSNVAGLYDTISETFYSSQSGTELIAGEVA